MHLRILATLFALSCGVAYAQQNVTKPSAVTPAPNGNIYEIKKQFLQYELHNPAEQEEEGEDNDLARFNRWFNRMEDRTYPDGNLPRPDVLLKAAEQVRMAAKSVKKATAGTAAWQLVGPQRIPANFNGIGRVNCIVLAPQDTSTIFIGTACGGVWSSNNGGSSWHSTTDNFPSLSIADIAVNPKHMDTVYAATGDGYGYENGGFNIFWGGLYSAGVMRSIDTGHTWAPTGLSYLQSNNDMIQRLLIHPRNTNILLAATRNGLMRSTDAGTTWVNVAAGHIFSMAFHPTDPDTVYAVDSGNLIVSYNAGATWTIRYAGMNASADRCTIGVSPASPNSIWVLNNAEQVMRSYNYGYSFTPTTTSPSVSAAFWGYYDRVLAISPVDSNLIYAFGKNMARSTNNGVTWSVIDNSHKVHVDFHAATINPLRPQTVYCGNDGGISVSYNGGGSWRNLGNGLVISQVYRVSSSRQDPSIVLAGLQDNGTFYNDGSAWWHVTGGDGMDNAISPVNDNVQVSSYQYGNFFLSLDKGASFSPISFSASGTGAWVSPVVFNPRNPDTIYFGLKNIYASYDAGATVNSLSAGSLFTSGAKALAVAPSDVNVLYAADNSRVMRTTDGGTSWVNISSGLPTFAAKTFIAVDYTDPMKVYVTTSGYSAANKVFMSTNGGTTWTNISAGLPNLPANCIAVDSTTPGALFVGTDMGMYYKDDTLTAWTPYSTGLPNVIVDDIDINYTNYKIRVATYGRGIWECKLRKDAPVAPTSVPKQHTPSVSLFPNPTVNSWKVVFPKQKPEEFTIRIMDAAGRTIQTYTNKETVDATALAKGIYYIEVTAGDMHESLKAVKY